MRIIVDVPEGTWNLDVVIDSDAAIAELDESNNAWSETYQSSGEGFSATILVAGGRSLLSSQSHGSSQATKGTQGGE